MAESKLEKKIEDLDKRLSFLEEYVRKLDAPEPLTEVEINRIKEADEWIKSGDTRKLVKVI